MATENQVNYYRYLCEQACIEPDEYAEDWDTCKMSEAIYELLDILNKK